MPVREQIGRFKYTLEDNLDKVYEEVKQELHVEIANTLGKEGF
jgi:V/A-type H+-transporting ATPase subunit A